MPAQHNIMYVHNAQNICAAMLEITLNPTQKRNVNVIASNATSEETRRNVFFLFLLCVCVLVCCVSVSHNVEHVREFVIEQI